MNHHYIEFMIKERRREEMDQCNRMRMLKEAGYTQTSFRELVAVAISQIRSSWRNLARLLNRSPGSAVSRRISLSPAPPEE